MTIVPVVASASRRRRRRHGARESMARDARAINHMSPLGLLVFGAGGILGSGFADIVDRKVAGLDPATTAANMPTGLANVTTPAQYNDLVVASKPSLGRIGAQGAISALGFLIGVFAPWPLLKMFGYGWGFGALFHLGQQLVSGYIVQPIMANATAGGTLATWGQEMYTHETNANAAIHPSTTAGPPMRTLGTPPGRGLPTAQPSKMPHELAGGSAPSSLGMLGAAQQSALAALAGGGARTNPLAPPVGVPSNPPATSTSTSAPQQPTGGFWMPPAATASSSPPQTTTTTQQSASNAQSAQNMAPQGACCPGASSGACSCGSNNGTHGAPPKKSAVHPIFARQFGYRAA